MASDADIIMFKSRLNELTKQYGIEIWGCGCCGSPALMDLSNGKFVAYEMNWNEDKKEYEYD